MTSPAALLVDKLREGALAIVNIAQSDFDTFVAPVLRDLDLIVTEEDPQVRLHLQRSLDAQVKSGVPELTRVTGQREIADRIYSMTMLGANLLIGLATSGFVNLAENLQPEDSE